MVRESNSCPDIEVLAAFVAGQLSGAELKMTAEHLRECEDCRLIVAEASRFEPSVAATPPRQWRSGPIWAVATAAALATVALVSWPMIRARRANAPMRALIVAAPRDGRHVEPRVSGGFPWAPLHPAQRGRNVSDPSQMQLVGAAGKVIEQTAGDTSPVARHASAVARLLTGSAGDAAAQLSGLSKESPEATVWSDLAAARYTEAVQTDDPPKLAQALAAADAALRIDAALPEALFNRALILERLGVRDQARAAWKRYLSADPASAWSREAEAHLQALNGRTEFPRELERTYAALASDARVVSGLVERFPQEARIWSESEILARWARCEIAGDTRGAETHLRLARMVGEELARRQGEMMLRDAVAAIERAGERATLAHAHVQFREAQRHFKSQELAPAESLFRDAAATFGAGGSPMALVARYYGANTVFEQGRVDEARIRLEEVLSQSRPEFKALAALIQWELGMAYGARARWGKALETFHRSIAGFQALRETNNEMAVREILAEVYDRIGEPRKAWSHRIVALQELGRSDDLRLQVAIYAIARGAALNHDWPVGLAFTNLQTELSRHRGDEAIHVYALLLRAGIRGRMGERRAAADDLSNATAAIASIAAVALREQAEAEGLAVKALLAPSPSDAIGLWSRAIDFQRTKGRRMFLPELLLERGRAFAATGQQDQALIDFENGIHELEDQRVSIAPGDERWGMFGAADELFDEAVKLALKKGDPARAFAYSERARARELLDSMGMTAVPATPVTLPKAIILEYVHLRDRIIIFVVDGDRIRVAEEQVASSVVADDIERLTRSAVSGNTAEFDRWATVLYDRLLGPVADELASGLPLIVIPDGTLTLVPFAALMDPAGRYVIERRAVIVAPSVAVLSHAPKRKLSPAPRLLVVAGPPSREGDLGRLTSEQREIEAVAAEYHGNVGYASGSDIADALQRRASTANVVHFVGHAVIPGEDTGGALVTSRRESPEEQLDVRKIAAMHFRDISVVVLAACGTARGHGRAGEPSVSLARAFLAGGVPNVAATLWPIEDGPAAEFFPRFHHYLVRGLPPADALRAAQLEWIRRRDISPGVWAAVEIIGN